jgi:hypothetical protein
MPALGSELRASSPRRRTGPWGKTLSLKRMRFQRLRPDVSPPRFSNVTLLDRCGREPLDVCSTAIG